MSSNLAFGILPYDLIKGNTVHASVLSTTVVGIYTAMNKLLLLWIQQ
jgi:hypothetical protein